MSTATSRLRKTFHYPSESDNDSDADLDEEHQEKLITTLAEKDAKQSSLYRNLFTAIPVLASLLTLINLILRPRNALTHLLTLTSLFATTYTLHYQPVPAPDHKGKTPLYKLESTPLEKYLIPANGALAGLLFLAAGLNWRQGKVAEAWQTALPGLVFGICMFARRQLAPVDLEELRRGMFELKGA